ncbi:hypothetical protein [Microbulbifer sp. VAAF005]|uniref:hypothetical protein n=1 Tax=Microbulbifer sp. VAAF005 TaxID=3034230 RepID=UPI0024ADC42A|nr:hypothetical protein [Microbulbifer sp. VAAF005]WHI46786.1 hypothetical protein P0078_24330 [Microbulbifer sp. VAAF005]
MFEINIAMSEDTAQIIYALKQRRDLLIRLIKHSEEIGATHRIDPYVEELSEIEVKLISFRVELLSMGKYVEESSASYQLASKTLVLH